MLLSVYAVNYNSNLYIVLRQVFALCWKIILIISHLWYSFQVAFLQQKNSKYFNIYKSLTKHSSNDMLFKVLRNYMKYSTIWYNWVQASANRLFTIFWWWYSNIYTPQKILHRIALEANIGNALKEHFSAEVNLSSIDIWMKRMKHKQILIVSIPFTPFPKHLSNVLKFISHTHTHTFLMNRPFDNALGLKWNNC